MGERHGRAARDVSCPVLKGAQALKRKQGWRAKLIVVQGCAEGWWAFRCREPGLSAKRQSGPQKNLPKLSIEYL
jgi:hypothetical protein